MAGFIDCGHEINFGGSAEKEQATVLAAGPGSGFWVSGTDEMKLTSIEAGVLENGKKMFPPLSMSPAPKPPLRRAGGGGRLVGQKVGGGERRADGTSLSRWLPAGWRVRG